MSATCSYPLSVPLQHPDQGFDAWKPEFLVRDHDNTLRKLFKKGIECLPVLVTIDPSVQARFQKSINLLHFPCVTIMFWLLYSDLRRLSSNNKSLEKKYKQNFHDFWKDKSEEELWDALFLEKCVDGCTDILLCHPMDDSWVVRNPIKEGKWWEMLNVNACRTPLHNSPLPCDGCSGRGASKICSGQIGETMNETTGSP